MADFSRLVPDIQTVKTQRMELQFRAPAPGVLWVRASGHASADFVTSVVTLRNAAVKAWGRVTLFDDLDGLTGYDPGVRAGLTEWVNQNKGAVTAVHILVRSRVVAMGVGVANMVLRGVISAHSDRAVFDRELEAAVRRAR
jgi:hypothetical protein